MRFPLTKSAQKLLEKRYIHKELGESSWEDVVERVLEAVVPNNKDAYREILLERYFVPNSPCLVNAGTKINGLSACYVVPLEDSLESIYRTKFEFAKICQKGGGCGTTLSNIRPEGEPVAGSTHSHAAGPVEFGDTICKDMDALTQAGFRNMAMMLTMRFDHPDIENFITAKTEEGSMHTTNISVMIKGEHMKKIVNDEPVVLQFGDKNYGKIPAKYLFDLIAQHAWKNGEPGLLFEDTINEHTPYKYSGQYIESTNPCVSGDTRILTVDGPKRIQDLVGTNVQVYAWNPRTKLPVIKTMRNIRKTKSNAELLEIEFDSGLKVKVTPDHNFRGFRGNKVLAKELRVGQSVRSFAVSQHKNGQLRAHAWVDDKTHQKVVSITPTNSEDVYNGTVDDVHTYIIGDPEYRGPSDNGVYSGIVSCNCGEQPLPEYGVCNLGSIDLSKFINAGEVNWSKLERTVELSVEFLDAVLDVSDWPLEKIEQWVQDNRAIGLGVMGLADALLELEMVYGSNESLEWIHTVMEFISTKATKTSERLGEEKGIPKNCELLPTPRRNITTLSIAPTGSIAIIAGCSHGIEPIYSPVYTRLDEDNNKYDFIHPKAGKNYFRSAINDDPNKIVHWKSHIEVQGAFQFYVDSGVSKTINFPKDATVEDIKNSFIYAWRNNCKGITVYRDGSRKHQILNPKKDLDFDSGPVTIESIGERKRVLDSKTFKIKGGDENGNVYVTVSFDKDRPYEVFYNSLSLGLEDVQMRDGFSRLSSLALRWGVPVEELIKELRQIPAQSLKSVPARIAKVLEELITDVECPKCGTALQMIEGCESCLVCGYSKCG